jgi:hypothetical protein
MEDGRSNASAEGEHDDNAGLPVAGAEVHLGNAGSVRIVHDSNGTAEVPFEKFGRIDLEPGVVNIRGGVNSVVFDNAGEGDSRRPLVVEVGCDLAHDFGHGVGKSRLWGGDAESLGDECASCDIDRRAFDAGSADIDAKNSHGNF